MSIEFTVKIFSDALKVIEFIKVLKKDVYLHNKLVSLNSEEKGKLNLKLNESINTNRIIVDVFLGSIKFELVEKVLTKMKRTLNQKRKSPPKILFIAAFFLPPSIREISLGDMEEIYKKDVKRFGVKKAKWLLAKDIFVSNFPILKELVKKSAKNLMKLAGLYKVVRWIIG